MPTPGAANRLNNLSGVASCLVFTAAQEAKDDVMARVIETPGVLIRWSDKTASLTDGTSTLAELKATPQIDQRLLQREKDALMKTFSGENGIYKATEGGFLVLSTDGRFTSAHMPKDIWNVDTGKILLSALPDTVRAGITFVKDLDALNAIDPTTSEAVRGFVMVMDASADPTVNKGSAVYCWTKPEVKEGEEADPAAGEWLKFQEMESIDLDLEELGVSSANVEEAGAVMYDHMILMKAPTIEDYFEKVDYIPTYVFASKILPDAIDHSKPKSIKVTIEDYMGTGEGMVMTIGSDSFTVEADGSVTATDGAVFTVTQSRGVFVVTPTGTPATSYTIKVVIPNPVAEGAPITLEEEVAFTIA